MKRFQKVTVKTDYAWSDWINPVMTNYHMKCCQCGLTHTLNFRVLRVDKGRKNGVRHCTVLPKGKYIVQLKARRNKKYSPK